MSIAQTDIAAGPQQEMATDWRLRITEGGALLRLATPIMLIALVNMGMSVTDTLMVSMLFGTDALAAVAVGSDLYSIVFYLCAGTLGGVAPFYAAAVARADAGDRARLERIGWMMVGLLAVAAVPLVWFAPAWLRHFGLEPGLLDSGAGYTRSMALTLIPMLGVTLYRTVLTAAENPKVFLRVTLAMLPLNAAGNYVLMLGVGPIPAFGPLGAGLSTLLVAVASLAILLLMARRAAGAAQSSGAPLDWHGLAAVLRVGIPIGITMVTETGIYLAVTLYAATLGAVDVAAHTLTLRMAGIVYAGSAGLQQAAMVRMARAGGLEDAAAGRAILASSLILSSGAGVVCCLLLAGGAYPLATWFFDASAAGTAAVQVAVGLLILLGLLQFVGYPGLAALGLLRGCKDTRVPMIYKLIAYWVIGAPLGVYLCEMQALGVTGLWIGLLAGAFLTTVLALGRLLARP
ncbi:MAG: MATE family efflux transporter [Ferrovibrio sp.]|uniref:MATE family efflux transporter n=1 Tax=Ferrovibrio sp. TaxID=1917215 RepID=UPI0026127061|nr:MATE family efflux transporter [Ferrovibrio sp.]MCW0233730.1 MATE family efflux transporter [Ferrovibrio sp.]